MGSSGEQTDNRISIVSNSLEEDPFFHAFRIWQSHFVVRVLRAAIDLKIFEKMGSVNEKIGVNGCRDGYVTSSQVASLLPTQNPEAASVLDRMFSIFVAHSLMTCMSTAREDGKAERLYRLTPAGEYLLRREDGRSLVSLYGFDNHHAVREVWDRAKDLMLETDDPFKRVHGMPLFQFMGTDPSLGMSFHEGMGSFSIQLMKRILEIYKGFQKLTSLVDIGGGTGKCLNMIVSKYPFIKGINFDLPHVIQQAPPYPGIQHAEGDMLTSIPKAEAIMIKDTLHDFTDECCRKILKNCYDTLPEDGKVIVITLIMPEEPDTSETFKMVSYIDIYMLMLTGGRERTEKEYIALSQDVGFRNCTVACRLYNVWSVMELSK